LKEKQQIVLMQIIQMMKILFSSIIISFLYGGVFLITGLIFYGEGYSKTYGGFMNTFTINSTVVNYYTCTNGNLKVVLNYNLNNIKNNCTLWERNNCYGLEYINNHYSLGKQIEIGGFFDSNICTTKNNMEYNAYIGFILIICYIIIFLFILIKITIHEKHINLYKLISKQQVDIESNVVTAQIQPNVVYPEAVLIDKIPNV
jgi:hypothetical protein